MPVGSNRQVSKASAYYYYKYDYNYNYKSLRSIILLSYYVVHGDDKKMNIYTLGDSEWPPIHGPPASPNSACLPKPADSTNSSSLLLMSYNFLINTGKSESWILIFLPIIKYISRALKNIEGAIITKLNNNQNTGSP